MMHEREPRRLAAAFGLALVLLVCPSMASAACGEVSERPWCDDSQSPAQRAELLLASMSQLEKVNLLGVGDPTGVLSTRETRFSTRGAPHAGFRW